MTEWLSVAQASQLLGVTDHTIYKLVNRGQLTAFRIGRSYRTRQEDIDAYLELVKCKPGDLDHLMPQPYDGPRLVDLRSSNAS